MYDYKIIAQSYWEATVNRVPFPTLESDITVDVAIIGGGFFGLSAALHLARDENISVAILEAGPIGWGASGRNGGINSIAATKLSIGDLVRTFGDQATRSFFRSQIDGQELVLDIANRESIPVDVCGDGVINAAHSHRAFAELREYSRELEEISGIRSQIFSRIEFAERFHRGTAQCGGLQTWPGCGIHPLKFTLGLAIAALKHGAQVYADSPVNQHSYDGCFHTLITERATVRSKHVIYATNAYQPDGLHPDLDARVLPAIANIMVTRPLTQNELNQYNFATDTPIVDTRHLLLYYRKLPDNRILFGSRGDLVGSDRAALQMRTKIRRSFNRIFPAWREVATDYFWRGLVALSRKRAPSLGNLHSESSIWYGFGCHGNGINNQTWMGRELSLRIAGKQNHVPTVYHGLPPKLPKSMFLRRASLKLAYAHYAVLDAIN